MGMVHSELFKILFGILLILILCMLNFNIYYLSEREYTALPRVSESMKNNASNSRLNYNTLKTTQDVHYQHEQLYHRDTKNSPTTRWRVTTTELELQYFTTAEKELELYNYPVQTKASDDLETSHYQNSSREELKYSFYQPPPDSNNATSSRGYVVATKIYEQQTMASGNLLQLQCWANYLNVDVVKPFMQDSNLLTPIDETVIPTMMKMDDITDMDDWNKHASDSGYAPLVEWEDFVQNAPRNLIIVQMIYSTLTYVRKVRAKGLSFPHPPDGSQNYKEGCKYRMFKKNGVEFLKKYGFKVLRKVCFNFRSGTELPMKQFRSEILGNYNPNQVTIIINEWRGLGEAQRVLIQDDICREKVPYREYTKPSLRVIADAKSYASTYLGKQSTLSTGEYLAVIARFEMTGLTRSINSRTDDHAIIPFCLQQTLKYLENLKQKSGLTSVFLSFDAGKYGSKSFVHKKYYGHLSDLESFVGKVYGGVMNIQEWEKTFENISKTNDSGYIAMLQQVIVTRAKCILFVGGGSFQRHAIHLYQELHPDPKDRCVEVIEKCTSAYRPIE